MPSLSKYLVYRDSASTPRLSSCPRQYAMRLPIPTSGGSVTIHSMVGLTFHFRHGSLPVPAASSFGDGDGETSLLARGTWAGFSRCFFFSGMSSSAVSRLFATPWEAASLLVWQRMTGVARGGPNHYISRCSRRPRRMSASSNSNQPDDTPASLATPGDARSSRPTSPYSSRQALPAASPIPTLQDLASPA